MFEAIGEGHKIMAEGPKKEIDLDALEQLAAQATPGPWEVDDCNNIRIAPKGRPIVATIHDDEDYLPRMADAQYIAAACNAVPELIARVRELERQRDWLAERLNFICHSDTDCVLGCPDVMNGNCSNVTRSQWIEASKDATSYVNKL